MDSNQERVDIIEAYVNMIIDEWHMHIDHEDASTAPFTSTVLEQVCLKS